MSDRLITFFDIYDHAIYLGEDVVFGSIPFVWQEALWAIIDEFEIRLILPEWLHLLLRSLVIYFICIITLLGVEVFIQLFQRNLDGSGMRPATALDMITHAVSMAYTIMACIYSWEIVIDEELVVDDFFQEDFVPLWRSVIRLCLAEAIVNVWSKGKCFRHAPLAQSTPVGQLLEFGLATCVSLANLATWRWGYDNAITRLCYAMLPILGRLADDDEESFEVGENHDNEDENWEDVVVDEPDMASDASGGEKDKMGNG